MTMRTWDHNPDKAVSEAHNDMLNKGYWMNPFTNRYDKITEDDRKLAVIAKDAFTSGFRVAFDKTVQTLRCDMGVAIGQHLLAGKPKHAGIMLRVAEETEHTSPIARGLHDHLMATIEDRFGKQMADHIQFIAEKL